MIRAALTSLLLILAATETLAGTDLYGDPLPEGASLRLGTIRLRHRDASVVFAADGKTLLSCDSDGVLRRWDVAAGRQIQQKILWMSSKHKYPLRDILLAPDGEIIAVREEKTIHLYRADSGKEQGHLSLGDGSYAFGLFSRDTRLLATCLRDEKGRETIQLWDVPARSKRFDLSYEDGIMRMTFAPDGKTLAASTTKSGTVLWDTATGTQRQILPEVGWFAVYSPDGQVLAGRDRAHDSVCLWRAADGKKLAQLPVPDDIKTQLVHFAFSVDGKRLAGSSRHGLILWDVATRKVLRQLPEKDRRVAFSPDGRSLVCWGGNEINLWDVATGKLLHDRPGYGSTVDVLAASADGKLLASCAWGATELFLWDAATGRLIRRLKGSDTGMQRCAFTPDGRRVAASSERGMLQIWDTATGAELHRLKNPMYSENGFLHLQVPTLRFAPDGARVAVVSITSDFQGGRGQIHVWETATGKLALDRRYKVDFHSRPTANGGLGTWVEAHAALSPDVEAVTVRIGTRLAIEEVQTRRVLAMLPENVGRPVTFSPDGQLVAAGVLKPKGDAYDGYDMKGISLIEAVTGQEVLRLKTGEGYLTSFSPEGHLLATVDAEAIHVWDVASGTERFRRPWSAELKHRAEASPARSLVFLPGERGVATGLEDGAIFVWELPAAAKRPAHALDAEKLAALWSDLAGDAAAAHRAVSALAADPAHALPFLKEHCRPAEALAPERAAQLLADLGSDRFSVRQRAERELGKLGDLAEPALRRCLHEKPSLDLRKRIEAILTGARAVPTASRLRTLRAIRVLESIGADEARRILRELAGGAPVRETRAATKALARLAGR